MLEGNITISWRRLLALAAGALVLIILAVNLTGPIWAESIQSMISQPGKQIMNDSEAVKEVGKAPSEDKAGGTLEPTDPDTGDDAQSADIAWLGLELSDAESGVRVSRVVKDSPAAKAGVKEDDIITSVDDKGTTNSKEMIEAVQERKSGDTVTLAVNRGSESLQIEIIAGSSPTMGRITPSFGIWKLPPELQGLEGIPLREMFNHFVGGTFKMKDKNGRDTVINIMPGTVSSVTSNSLTIEPNQGGPAREFQVTDSTLLMGTGPREKIENLKAGTQVLVVTVDDSTIATVVSRASPVYSPLDQIMPHLRMPQIWSAPGPWK